MNHKERNIERFQNQHKARHSHDHGTRGNSDRFDYSPGYYDQMNNHKVERRLGASVSGVTHAFGEFGGDTPVTPPQLFATTESGHQGVLEDFDDVEIGWEKLEKVLDHHNIAAEKRAEAAAAFAKNPAIRAMLLDIAMQPEARHFRNPIIRPRR